MLLKLLVVAFAQEAHPAQEFLKDLEIKFYSNFGMHIDDRQVNVAGEPVDDKLFLRKTELEVMLPFESGLSARLVLSASQRPDLSFEFEPEEAHLLSEHVPLLEKIIPFKSVKLGRARAPLSPTNLVRLHELVSVTYPFSLSHFFGGDDGFFDSGFRTELVEFNLPILNSVDTVFGIMNNSTIPMNPTAISALSYFNNLRIQADLGGGILRAGHSVLLSEQATDITTVFNGLDVRLEMRGSLDVGIELYYASIERRLGPTKSPAGGFAFVQRKCSEKVTAGVRYDHAQDLIDDTFVRRNMSVYGMWNSSKNVTYKIEINYRRSDVRSEDRVLSLLIDVGLAFGNSTD